MAKPLFLFVPGTFHTPAHYTLIENELAKKGYEASTVSLPNIGAGAATAELYDDVKAVIDALNEYVVKQARDVVVVCHSYGSVPGCQAITGLEKSIFVGNGLPGGVIRIVFVSGILAREGETTLDVLKRSGQGHPVWIERDVCDFYGTDVARGQST